MVDLLLLLIKAERTGNWKLYLCTVVDMVPSLLAMARHNYLHWLPVYLSEKKQNGNHVVSR